MQTRLLMLKITVERCFPGRQNYRGSNYEGIFANKNILAAMFGACLLRKSCMSSLVCVLVSPQVCTRFSDFPLRGCAIP